MKQLVILAGGEGSRLKERLGNLPKPLISIDNKPLLEHQISLAHQHGFTDIIITVCHKAEIIQKFCGNGKQWSVNIRYIQEPQPQGTAGAILANIDMFSDTFLLMYGDTFLNINLSQFWAFHVNQGADVSLLLHPNDHPHDSDLVEVNKNNRIIAFHPYPHPENAYFANLVNAALYIIEKDALIPWKHLLLHTQGLDFAKTLFPLLLKENQFLLGYLSSEYIKDIGTPKRIDQVCADLRSGKIQRRANNIPNTAIFLDRDGTITQSTNYVTSPTELHLIPGAAAGIKKINHSGSLAFLATNQPVIARGNCSEFELQQIHHKLETLLGQESAFLDAIYYCPHHPDKGFIGERAEFKIPCYCRKPHIGMIQQAQQFSAIDMDRSWFIGDSSVDMQTAKNAGLKSILVRTGLSGCDDKYAARPDFECYDLEAAVTFALDQFPTLYKRAQTYVKNIQPGEHIVIGGLARSGKSTWATLIKYALFEKKIKSTIISLDGWLKDIDKRNAGDLLTRHHLETLVPFIHQVISIKKPATINIPSYNRLHRRPNKKTEAITIDENCILIFEGVIAFLLDDLLRLTPHHFYVQSSEKMRMSNFHKEYQLRGLSSNEINKLFQIRETDENQWIKKSYHSQQSFLIGEIE